MPKRKQPKPLFEFWKDTATRDNVHEYLVQFLKDEAVRMLMDREDVTGVAQAKDFIDKAFENMDLLFSIKRERKEYINEAR